MDVYEEVCGQCLDDLYRIAFIALGDEERAAQTVESVCKAGVYARNLRADTDAIRLWLCAELYRRCKAQLSEAPPTLPQALHSLPHEERLLLALRVVLGLTKAEAASLLTAHP